MGTTCTLSLIRRLKNISGVVNQTIKEMERMDYSLKENGKHFMEQVNQHLNKQRSLNESGEYIHYLGVQLDPSKIDIYHQIWGTHCFIS